MDRRTSQHDSRSAWLAAFAALIILTIAHGAPMIVAVALKSIAVELGSTRAEPSAAGSFAYIGAGIGGIAAGKLADRWGARYLVLFGGIMVASGLLVSTMGGLGHLYVGHGLLMGFLGTSCMLSPLITYVSFWFVKQRGAAIALVSSGQSIAGVVWPLLFAWGIAWGGWRWVMQIYGVFSFIAITVVAFCFLAPPPAVSTSPVAAGTGLKTTSIGGLSPIVAMTALMLAVFSCCVPMNMPMQHIVAYCGDIGLSSQHGAAMLSVLLGVAFLARQFWGWLADRIGGLQTLAWSSALQFVSLAGLVATQDEVTLFAISAVFGFGLSGLLPAYVITVREYFPAREAAWRVPTVLLAGYVGMAAGGWGAGALYDMFGFYLPAFAIGLIFNILNLAVLLWLICRAASVRMDPESRSSLSSGA